MEAFPTLADRRCAHCRAALRPDAPWCTLCLTRVETETETEVAAQVVRSDPPAPPSGSGWPCSTCAAPNPLEADRCAACGAGFLAAVRADDPALLTLPGVGDVSRLSKVQQLGLAATTACLAVLLTLLMGLLAR